MKVNFKLAALSLFAAALIAAGFLLPIKDWLFRFLGWVDGLGFWGPVLVVLFYVVACVCFLPGSVITLGTGFIFKVVAGSIIVSIGSTLGACAAFWVGRTIARDWIVHKVASNEKFRAIDNAVGEHGFKIVLLLRLSPVFPFNLLNYALGLTKVPFRTYALASWLGMMPGTVMYVYFGAGLRSLADAAAGKVEAGHLGPILFWVGMAATVSVTVYVTGVARKALKKAA